MGDFNHLDINLGSRQLPFMTSEEPNKGKDTSRPNLNQQAVQDIKSRGQIKIFLRKVVNKTNHEIITALCAIGVAFLFVHSKHPLQIENNFLKYLTEQSGVAR